VNSYVKDFNPDFIVYDFAKGTHTSLWKTLSYFNLPVVAVIHNIEFMATASNKLNLDVSNFLNQVQAIRSADLNITISHFDDYVCRIYGANTFLYDYQISPDELCTFNKIASSRMSSKNKICNKILILGTAYNTPTRDGMSFLLKNSECWNYNQDELLVVGCGTEMFFKEGKGIQVLGEVSHSKLYSILSIVKCCVIFQPPSSGKLTKLVDLLICKIPVYINADYFLAEESDMLTKYSSFDELRVLIASINKERNFIESNNASNLNDNINFVIRKN